MTPTIRWTSHAMYLSDQGNGDSCWVLYADYTKLQDVTIQAQHTAMDAMNRVLAAQAALTAFREQVAKCSFEDDHGHPLHMNAAYIALCSSLNGPER
jgi:hypothetical protein